MKKYLLTRLSNIVFAASPASFLFLSITTVLCLPGQPVHAQVNNNILLSGKIVEQRTNAPLEGATVHIKGTLQLNDMAVMGYCTRKSKMLQAPFPK